MARTRSSTIPLTLWLCLLGLFPLALAGRRQVLQESGTQCDASFRQALQTCYSEQRRPPPPDSACCSAFRGLGGPCLQAVQANFTGSANDLVQPTLEWVLLNCNVTSSSGAGATAPGTSLPVRGSLQSAWRFREEPVWCPRYIQQTGAWGNDTAAGKWGAKGSMGPPDTGAVLEAANAWCASPDSSGQDMLRALDAGGPQARVAVAAIYATECVYGEDLFPLFASQPELRNPVALTKYAEAFAKAADEIGLATCITLVSLDASGKVLATSQVHTTVAVNGTSDSGSGSSGSGNGSSGGSPSPGGITLPASATGSGISAPCYSAFEAAIGACSDALPVAPGSPCCDGWEGLGKDCWAEMFAAADLVGDAGFSAELQQTYNDCALGAAFGGVGTPPAPSPPAPAPPAVPGAATLPDGLARPFFALGRNTVTCSTYNSASGNFASDTELWSGSGGAQPPAQDVDAMAAAICKGPAATAGRALLDAFLAGGAAAQAAVQALVTASCPAGVDSDAASQAAYSVFVLSPELREPQEALRAATNFVAAADALGFGACVTLVVLDAAGSVLEERQIHTSRSAGGAVTAPFTEAPKLEVGSALHQPPFSAVLRIGGGGGGDLRFAPAARATPLEGGTGGAADGLSLSSRGSPVLSSGSLNATGDSECYGAFEAAIDSCAGDASQAPGSDCCGGWEALGPDCWDWLFQAAATTADHDFVTTAQGVYTDCQLDAAFGFNASGGSNGTLPPGNIVMMVSIDQGSTPCQTYDDASGTWADSAELWGSSGTAPPPAAMQDVGAQLCSAPAAAGGRALYDAFLAGGAGAQAALGALMEHTCPAGVDTDAAIEGAFSEFLYSAGLWNPAAALRVADNLVAAADSLGYGACVSLAVLDEGGQLAVERQVHTGGTGGGQRPGGGAVRSAAGRSRLRAASRPA